MNYEAHRISGILRSIMCGWADAISTHCSGQKQVQNVANFAILHPQWREYHFLQSDHNIST